MVAKLVSNREQNVWYTKSKQILYTKMISVLTDNLIFSMKMCIL